MALVERIITGTYKDADGNLLTGKTLEFQPVDFVGGGGVVVPKAKVRVVSDSVTGEFSLSLYTSDAADSFVRYSVLFHTGEKKRFDVIAGAATTLDELINAYDGAAIISGASVLAALLSRLAALESGFNGKNFIPTAGVPQLVDYSNHIALTPPSPLPIGHTDLYTVPAGFRAVLWAEAFNDGGATGFFYGAVKREGVYDRVYYNESQAIYGNAYYRHFYLAEAGETLAIYTSIAFFRLRGYVVLIPDSNPIKTLSKFGLVTGENVLYTVPAGKKAYGFGLTSPGLITETQVAVMNDSAHTGVGTSMTFFLRHVPSGEVSSDAHNIARFSGTGLNDFRGVPRILMAGDKIIVQSTADYSFANVWMTVVEVDV